jgi:GMP synthase-like glutamine amidotransferase
MVFSDMKPIAICRFAPHEGAGYFATYLSERGIPWRVVGLDVGDSLPDVNGITGLAMMGGAMSVNDDLPWIAPMLALVRKCIATDVPVIGHCLGGQLLAKALGATVRSNEVKEIGWGSIAVMESLAAAWGTPEDFTSYHWHGETFSIPARATRIWSSAYCRNQAFVLGKHLGMQCHIEMTEDMIETWTSIGLQEIESSRCGSPAVQTREEMLENVSNNVKALHRIADHVYARWAQGLVSG